jgi:hypothetical protein
MIPLIHVSNGQTSEQAEQLGIEWCPSINTGFLVDPDDGMAAHPNLPGRLRNRADYFGIDAASYSGPLNLDCETWLWGKRGVPIEHTNELFPQWRDVMRGARKVFPHAKLMFSGPAGVIVSYTGPDDRDRASGVEWSWVSRIGVDAVMPHVFTNATHFNASQERRLKSIIAESQQVSPRVPLVAMLNTRPTMPKSVFLDRVRACAEAGVDAVSVWGKHVHVSWLDAALDVLAEDSR